MTINEFLNNSENTSGLKGKQIVVHGSTSEYWWDNFDKILKKVVVSPTHINLYV